MKNQNISIVIIVLVINTLNIKNTKKNHQTKTKKMLKIQNKKYNNQNFNDVAFTNQGYSFYIEKYVFI